MDKKLTDKEIVKALEEEAEKLYGAIWYQLNKVGTEELYKTVNNALDLINRLQAEKQNLEIEFKAMRGAANSYKAEVERLQNILICFMEALGKVRNVDDIDSISLIPLMSELNKGIRAEFKAEAYKEFAEKLHEELRIYGIKDKFDKSVFLNVVDKAKKELVGEDK